MLGFFPTPFSRFFSYEILSIDILSLSPTLSVPLYLFPEMLKLSVKAVINVICQFYTND